MNLTKEEYIEQFAVNFVSVWAARNYDDYCMRGLHKQLENIPIEDALFLAERSWDKFHEFAHGEK